MDAVPALECDCDDVLALPSGTVRSPDIRCSARMAAVTTAPTAAAVAVATSSRRAADRPGRPCAASAGSPTISIACAVTLPAYSWPPSWLTRSAGIQLLIGGSVWLRLVPDAVPCVPADDEEEQQPQRGDNPPAHPGVAGRNARPTGQVARCLPHNVHTRLTGGSSAVVRSGFRDLVVGRLGCDPAPRLNRRVRPPRRVEKMSGAKPAHCLPLPCVAVQRTNEADLELAFADHRRDGVCGLEGT